MRTHGESRTRLYFIWTNMLTRCNNPKNAKYRCYGAQGITVCDDWKDFAKFRDWALNSRYQDDLTIDRIDGKKGYYPENCRWATLRQQCCNKRPQGRSGLKGVYLLKGRWKAKIGVKGKSIHLGTFDTAIEAAKAYNKAAQEHHGEFAWLNLIEE